MSDESFKQQVRKKILEMKPDAQNFYTETFNLVAVILKLNPDPELEPIRNRMVLLYRKPKENCSLSLSQMESLYRKYREEGALKIRGMATDFEDIKEALDKGRQDLLFYLALIEDRPRNYNIIIEKQGKISKGSGKK